MGKTYTFHLQFQMDTYVALALLRILKWAQERHVPAELTPILMNTVTKWRNDTGPPRHCTRSPAIRGSQGRAELASVV